MAYRLGLLDTYRNRLLDHIVVIVGFRGPEPTARLQKDHGLFKWSLRVFQVSTYSRDNILRASSGSSHLDKQHQTWSMLEPQVFKSPAWMSILGVGSALALGLMSVRTRRGDHNEVDQ